MMSVHENDKYDQYEPLPEQLNKKKDFINERIVAALDVAKVSDYKSLHIIASVAEALGHSLNDLVVSRTTLNRIRKQIRKKTALKIKQNLEVLHFL